MEKIDLASLYGEKTAALLKDNLGSNATKAILDCDMGRLLQIQGMGAKKAITLIRKAHASLYGSQDDDILTGNSEEIYDKLVRVLQPYLATEGAKNKLLAYFPVTSKELIEKRQDYFEKASETYDAISGRYEKIRSLFTKLSPVRDTKPRKYYEYVILTDSESATRQIKNPYCDDLFMSSPSEAEYAHNSYSFMIYVHAPDSHLAEYAEGYADKIVDLDEFDAKTIVPDMAVEKFVENEETLCALSELLALLGKPEEFLDSLLELVHTFKNRDAAAEKKIEPDELVTFLREKEQWLNKTIVTTIKERGIGIQASNLLDLVSSIGTSDDPIEALKRSLPAEFDELYQGFVKEILDEVEGLCGLDAESLFPQSFTYPVTLDSEALYDLRAELEASDFKSIYNIKKEIASYARYWDKIDDLLATAVEYDFQLGMGRFVSERGCTRPHIVDTGLSFTDGLNLYIKDAKAVSYKIGTTPHDFASDDRVSVLTGANSGGKTTLLETMLTSQILTQMGMLVPAREYYTTLYEKIRYLAKAKSQNAGAFETTISSLVPAATEQGRRLLLIDELESITEPGSAAMIIATLIEILKENDDAFSVIVTHLGEEISELAEVRIDGIEASGLDDDLNLIVERQPKFGTIGKSTPELIVEKLFRSSKGEVSEVYRRMLEKLKEHQ